MINKPAVNNKLINYFQRLRNERKKNGKQIQISAAFDTYFDSYNNFWLLNEDGIFKIKDKDVSFYSFSNIKNKIPFFNVYSSTTFVENDKKEVDDLNKTIDNIRKLVN